MKKKIIVCFLVLLFIFQSTITVQAADLSVHEETSGNFIPVYSYKNPFQNKNTSSGVRIRFHAVPNGDVHILGTIFSLHGKGDYDGRIFFTPGSYLGMNISS